MFSHSVRVLSILGFNIKIDPSWLFIAALIVWSLSTGYFPSVVPDASREAYLTLSIFAMLGFFASLVLHELAHSLVARRYGVRIKGITLFLFGGVAELEDEPQTAGVEFWIAIAGPLASLFLASSFWVLGLFTEAIGLGPMPVTVLKYLALINLILALFNLLPAFPLDGGRVYRAILWNKTNDLLEATRRASNLGSTFAYVLMALGFLGLLSGQSIAGLWQVFIGLFLLAASKSTYQRQLMHAQLDHKYVADMMTPKPVTITPGSSLAELVNLVMLKHRTSFVPVVENGVLLGYVDGVVLSKIDRENWASTSVDDIFAELDENNTVSPTMTAEAVMEKIAETGRRKFLVVDGRRLVGVVTLSDLLGYLNVLREVKGEAPQQSWAAS